ncbi:MULTISPECIES: PKD domain-containing protein [Methanobacterium]|uniref:PKD domain-containing protein n=1 Tax=Methanobacterium veterum TaxID=408577 RepID=A0A9E5DH56_9EURY|nr:MULTISPECIES: PKD domain-containing protein [Methanobacterium]MCZ3365336.1 PKD domain-containing protein [Methanobacterium veterum]MCZ3373087.1 PKD domain-containing protein [Methanobacterium veterum]
MLKNKKTFILAMVFLFICITAAGGVSAADAPSASFTSNATGGSADLSVQFNDTSAGSPTSWYWNFGDGKNSTEQNPVHNYTAAGKYTVSLKAGNEYGSDTTSNYIHVYDSADAANRFNNSGFETGDLSGWKYGNTTEVSSSKSHSGNYSVNFRNTGNASTNYIQQNVDLTIVDNISFWCCGDLSRQLNVYIDGVLVKSVSTSNKWTEYTISTSSYTGIHSITLNCTGGTTTYLDDFSVSFSKNLANFTSTTTYNSKKPLTIQFKDTSTGLVTSWLWDFGDGTTSTQKNPLHSYTRAGIYTVKLTVTGPYCSSTQTIDDMVNVVQPTNARTGKTYDSIQAAIDDAENGDTINIGSTSYLETYTENVKVTKRVNIVSNGNVIITALDVNNPVFSMLSGGNNSLIKGFTITGAAGSSGIYIAPSVNAAITGNIITGNKIGIDVEDGTATVTFNSIYNNTLYGLKFTGNGLNAENNWWGTNSPSYVNGTTAPGKTDIYEAQSGSHAVYDPWIVLKAGASDDLLKKGDKSTITVDMTHNSNGQDTSSQGTIPDLPVDFNYTLGTFSTTSTTVSKGKASTVTTGGSTSGTDDASVTVTGCTVYIPITVDTVAPTTNATSGGTFPTSKTVTITTSDPTATIYYTADGIDPRTSSTKIKYTKALTISKTTTLRYAAVDPAGNWSPLYLQNYVIGTGGLANSSYPTYGINNSHTGQSSYTGPQTNATKWTYKGITVYGSAAVGTDGTIYIGGYNGKVYAFNSNGALKWTYTTASYILGSPTLGTDGTIYISCWMNSTLYAINPDGTLKWKYKTGKYNFGSSPAIGADGTIYTVDTSSTVGTVYALSSKGTLKWTYHTAGSIYGSSAAIGSDGTIYIADYNGALYAINPDGTQKWIYKLLFSSYKNATIKNSSGTTYYVTPSIGADGTIYVESQNNLSYNLDGYCGSLPRFTLFVINPDGTLKWTYNTTEELYGAPAISSDGTIYIIGASKLYAISSSGELLWTYSIGEVATNEVVSATIGHDGTIYVGSSAGIYALTPNGSLKWNYAAGSICASPVISSDGTLYVGTINGTLYAFKNIGANFVTKTSSKTVKFTDKSTGSPKSWLWSFGDGKTSTEQNPTHTYAKDGDYTVTLTVTSSKGTDKCTQTCTIDNKAPTASANYKSGWYNKNLNVTLKMSETGTIYYTTNGATPTTSSKKYTGAFTISKSTTLKFIAVDKTGNQSPIYTAKYVIDKTRPYVKSMYPKKSSTGISRSNTLYIKFSENLKTSINWSKVYIKNLKTGKKVALSKVIKNNVLYLKTGKRSANTWYQIYIPAAAIKDAAGNNGIRYTWKFKTGRY